MKHYKLVLLVYASINSKAAWTIIEKNEKYYEIGTNAYEDYMDCRASLNYRRENGMLPDDETYVVQLWKDFTLKEQTKI